MLPTALEIRNALLSTTPTVQDGMTRRLGYSQPHIELVALSSALRSDMHDIAALSPLTVKRILNVASAHLALYPIQTPAAKADTLQKAREVARAAPRWGMHHKAYQNIKEHLEGLCFELQGYDPRFDRGRLIPQAEMPALAA